MSPIWFLIGAVFALLGMSIVAGVIAYEANRRS